MIRIITALALRLFAMYVLALGVLEIPVLILRLIHERVDPGAGWLVVMGPPAAVVALTLSLFVLLWRLGGGALRTAAALDSLAANVPPATADLRRWQALLVGLMGLYFCCAALIDAMTMALIFLPTPSPVWVHGLREARLMDFDVAALSAGSSARHGQRRAAASWCAR